MAMQASDLKKYNYFSGLSSESLETISQKMSAVSFASGAVIFNENDDADSFYFVKQGRLDVTKTTKFGQTAKLSVLGSGQGFGEMALLDRFHALLHRARDDGGHPVPAA